MSSLSTTLSNFAAFHQNEVRFVFATISASKCRTLLSPINKTLCFSLRSSVSFATYFVIRESKLLICTVRLHFFQLSFHLLHAVLNYVQYKQLTTFSFPFAHAYWTSTLQRYQFFIVTIRFKILHHESTLYGPGAVFL